MELLTLDATFRPQGLIENYKSLIWTERYSQAGDFELQSSSIAETMTALPLESYVSLRESTVPMVVESHKIEKPKNSSPIITVSGRSFEASALERRVSVNSPFSPTVPRAAWTLTAAKESDAAYKAMRIVLGDIARLQEGVQVLAAVNPAMSPNDAIPEIDLVLPNDYSTSSDNTYEISADYLYKTVSDLIATNNHGIKSVRPLDSGTQVGVEIYNGADLTNTVVFDARFDQFDSATYLLSNQGSANVAYVFGSNGSQQVLKTAAPEPSGLARRVLLLDETSDANTNTVDIRKTRGLIELYKNNVTALFDGEISIQVAQGYNTRYFLGDILKLVGEYGLSQNVRVSEFIRTEDAEGEKAYPAFEAIS